MKEYRVTYEVTIKYTKVLRFPDDQMIEDVLMQEGADKRAIAEKLNADAFECEPMYWMRTDRIED